MSDFEIMDSGDAEYVRRGRKAHVDQKLVDALAKLPKGKAIALTSLAQNPKADTFANDKARIASQIRTACRLANIQGYRILWSPAGVPQVVRWNSAATQKYRWASTHRYFFVSASNVREL